VRESRQPTLASFFHFALPIQAYEAHLQDIAVFLFFFFSVTFMAGAETRFLLSFYDRKKLLYFLVLVLALVRQYDGTWLAYISEPGTCHVAGNSNKPGVPHRLTDCKLRLKSRKEYMETVPIITSPAYLL
jgi:hypothetical protein